MSNHPAFKLLLTLTLLATTISNVLSLECDKPTQQDGLVALYNQTNGKYWFDESSWLDTTIPCKSGRSPSYCCWRGVSCTQDGDVAEIQLRLNNLTGPFPALALERLCYIKKLDLYNNHLKGTLPTGVSALSRLEALNVGKNGTGMHHMPCCISWHIQTPCKHMQA